MASFLLAILFVGMSLEIVRAASVAPKSPIDSQNVCLFKKFQNPTAKSGNYYTGTVFGNIVQIYCDMTIDGGGYTFINPTFLSQMSDIELSFMISDATSLLFVYRKADGTEYQAELSQLPQYSDTKLKVGLNDNAGYKDTQNLNILGTPYLYFGFLPTTLATNSNDQGIEVDGRGITFRNCDSNPNSYIALFPNFSRLEPSKYLEKSVWPFCDQIFSGCKLRPASENIPDYYFMLAEFHFGGCGCYTQTNRIKDVVGVAIGFK